MRYCLYKLKFHTSLHVGESDSARSLQTGAMTPAADTLFSALCHAALSCGGEAAVQRLYCYAAEGALRFSDALPYCGERLYLPKPIAAPLREPEKSGNSADKKKMKQLAYLPVDRLEDFMASLRGEANFDPDGIAHFFGRKSIAVKANTRNGGEAEPYFIGLFTFCETAGLYFAVGYEETAAIAWVEKLFQAAALSGIGGKTSAGYGKFSVAAVMDLSAAPDWQGKLLQTLFTKEAPAYLSLTTALPTEPELESAMDGAFFQVVRRGGYVFSPSYGSAAVKKRTQYFFSAGSVFRHRFGGAVYSVGAPDKHPVYRYGRPIFVGVEL